MISKSQSLIFQHTNSFSYLHTQLATEEKWDEQIFSGRMDVELHDYPGSGANNHHTPKPPL